MGVYKSEKSVRGIFNAFDMLIAISKQDVAAIHTTHRVLICELVTSVSMLI